MSVSTSEVPGPGPAVTRATGSVELELSRTWEGPGAAAAGRPSTGERPGSSDSVWPAWCSAHPAARGGEPISGSGSTWTIPFSISSGPRCSPRPGVSPIPTCGVPPLGEPSGPEDLAGSSLGRSALSSSESISLCWLVPGSVENQPTPDSSRCRDPAGPIADSSAAVATAARGEMSPPLLDPAPPGGPPLMESATVALSADADPTRWPGGSGSSGSAFSPSEVGCSTTRPSDRSWAWAGTSCSRSWSPGPAAPASRSGPAAWSPWSTWTCSTDTCSADGCSTCCTSSASTDSWPATSPFVVGDLEVMGSWSGVMSMCHRTASGGSVPQIGSCRASAGSCLGAVSRNGHSRD